MKTFSNNREELKYGCVMVRLKFSTGSDWLLGNNYNELSGKSVLAIGIYVVGVKAFSGD